MLLYLELISCHICSACSYGATLFQPPGFTCQLALDLTTTGLTCLLAAAPCSVLLSLLLWCATADGQNGRAVLAACAARRWLARNAADLKLVHTYAKVEASEWTSLFCCLPAVEDVKLYFYGLLTRDDLGCLLEALAGCPRLRGLDLSMEFFGEAESHEGPQRPFPDASTFAKLTGLTKLALHVLNEADAMSLADVVGALVPLTGLAELSLGLPQPAFVPAALGQFKGLQSLAFDDLRPCVLEAGCLDLPVCRAWHSVTALLRRTHRCCQASLLLRASLALSSRAFMDRASLTLDS